MEVFAMTGSERIKAWSGLSGTLPRRRRYAFGSLVVVLLSLFGLMAFGVLAGRTSGVREPLEIGKAHGWSESATDGRGHFAIEGLGEVLVYDAGSSSTVRIEYGSHSPLAAMSVSGSPDGIGVAFVSHAKELRTFVVSNGAVQNRPKLTGRLPFRSGREPLALSHDCRTIYCADDTGRVLQFGDVGTAPISQLSFPDGDIATSIAVSGNGFVAIGTVRGRLLLLDGELKNVQIVAAHPTSVHVVAFSSDGRSVAVASAEHVAVFDAIGDVKLRARFSVGSTRGIIAGLSFSPTGRFVAVATGSSTIPYLCGLRGGIELFEVATGGVSPFHQTIEMPASQVTFLQSDYRLATYEGRIPNVTLPIASDPGGNLFLLDLHPDRLGSVYFWEREYEVEEGEEPTMDNVVKVADNFTDLLARLVDD